MKKSNFIKDKSDMIIFKNFLCDESSSKSNLLAKISEVRNKIKKNLKKNNIADLQIVNEISFCVVVIKSKLSPMKK